MEEAKEVEHVYYNVYNYHGYEKISNGAKKLRNKSTHLTPKKKKRKK